MKKALLASLVFISSYTYAQVTVNWSNYPGGVAVASDSLNNVYTANWVYGAGGDITLTKRDVAGTILWEVAYDNTDQTRHEVATWVATDHVGNILVSGTIRSGYSNPVNAASVLMKFNTSGTLLWRVVYESTFDGSSTKKCLVDANDNIYVLGIGTGTNGQVAKVKKFNTDGNSIWNYFDTGIGAPINFKLTPDNCILISHSGITGNINGYSKIDLNGNNIWSLAGINSMTVGDAAGDSFGNTYIINGEYVVSNAGSIIKKLSPAGAIIWSQTNTMKGNRVEVGTDNNPVISGYPLAGFGAAFIKYDSTGNVLWQNLDADGPATALMMHAQLRLDGANSAYLAAATPYPGQMAVCKVNSNGTAAWLATAPGSNANAIDFGTGDNIFVTGGTTARLVQNTVIIPPPATPTGLTASVSGTTINLSWTDNATDENNYVVQRSLAPNSGFANVTTIAANSNAYSNTGLAYATTYYYRVQATNSNAASEWSNIASGTTSAAPVVIPNAPSNLTAISTGCGEITLNWTDNSNNEIGFEIRRATSLNGIYLIQSKVVANISSYKNTSVKKDKRYYYIVRSYNKAGYSAWSNKDNALTTCIPFLIDKNVQQQFGLYPNPAANGQFNITLPATITLPVKMDIISSQGQQLYTKQLNNYSNSIQIKGLTKGCYIISISNEKVIERQRLLIE
ncbi:MAG: fibronectin type III domain-containing protein [Ferruginibacter sp.]